MSPVAAAPGVIVFDFDPIGVIAGFAVRWQIAAVAAVVFGTLVLGGVIAVLVERARVARLAADPARARSVGLRPDDLFFIVAGGIAGAVGFGRLGWVLLYLDWYRARPDAILDPAVGGLTLAGGLVGGIAAGLIMAVVLGAPVARWLGVAIVPLLLALGLGKLAMVFGGAGQGLPTGASWATAYAGPGPWGSLAPLVPSHPAQVYEAATSGAALLVVLLLVFIPAFRRHPTTLFAVGIGAWAAGRFAVAFTWRDPALVGSLNGDQLVTLGIVAGALAVLAGIAIRARRAAWQPTGTAQAEPPRDAMSGSGAPATGPSEPGSSAPGPDDEEGADPAGPAPSSA